MSRRKQKKAERDDQNKSFNQICASVEVQIDDSGNEADILTMRLFFFLLCRHHFPEQHAAGQPDRWPDDRHPVHGPRAELLHLHLRHRLTRLQRQ